MNKPERFQDIYLDGRCVRPITKFQYDITYKEWEEYHQQDVEKLNKTAINTLELKEEEISELQSKLEEKDEEHKKAIKEGWKIIMQHSELIAKYKYKLDKLPSEEEIDKIVSRIGAIPSLAKAIYNRQQGNNNYKKDERLWEENKGK